ncbi:unnamed protein product [Rhizopus stolonifer]
MPSITPSNTTKSPQSQDTLPPFGYSQDKQIYMLPPPSSLPGYYLPLPALEEKKMYKSTHDDVSTAAATLASFSSHDQEDDLCPEKQVIEAAKILMNISRCVV